MMRPLVANVFDVSPWQRLKAALFPNKKDCKLINDKIELQCNIVADLAEVHRNKESVSEKGLLSSKDNPFKKIIVKGKNVKLWRVYFFGPSHSYVIFPYDSTIVVQKLLDGKDCQHWINDVYCNHEWAFELPVITEEYKHIYDWIEKNTDYHSGTYNPSLSNDTITYYKLK